MDNLSPEQIQQMIMMLQSMLPKQQETDGQITQQENIQQAIKTKPSRKQKEVFMNRFDEMIESNLHKDDVVIDKALTKHAPTPRMRKYTPVDVKCRVCGKNEQINPSLLNDTPERYKCNACARSAG